ncbi:metal ABC transporter permease [Clostridium sp. 19966]|uniref:metal ABC transporter permease n=1 Tax=Clostridium sp. 19966 TaxID=2768166 RepID=UPI0028DF6C03|nr:metal ABC transporter permease [Clostridium sp. 19966]MDT8719399.1 metal ABC transporter permease [Clostridium sp. 19966]
MLHYSFMQNAIIISLFISVLCPCIGMFLVLRRYSMIGDTLSHSSLAGVALGLLLNQNPIMSAFVFTSLCGILIEFLRNYFKRYAELILSIVLALGVGIAITIMSSGSIHANVNSFLFGSVLTVTKNDLYTVIALSIVAMAVITLLYNHLVILIFDEEGARASGIKVNLINYIFSVLVAATISISIRIVGVLVMGSMIALPVATALQINKGFKKTLIFSIFISVIDILSGIFISYNIDAAPGGVTALVSVFLLLVVIIIKKCYYSIKRASK